MSRRYSILFLVAFLASIFGLSVPAVQAVTETPAAINVAKDEAVAGNLIKAGNVITIAGAVSGDVVVAGKSITISGPVAGDVIAAGNTITITGPVAGSIRVAGSNVSLSGSVGHNVWVGANTVVLTNSATVGWDLIAFAGTTQVDGVVNGNLSAYTGSLVVNGKINKNVETSLGHDGHVVLTPTAAVGGTLVYRAAADTQLDRQASSTVVGAVTYQPLPEHQRDPRAALQAIFGFIQLVGFFGILVIGLIVVGLVPQKLEQIRLVMLSRGAPSLGVGALYLVVAPVALFVSAITVIGLPLAIVGGTIFVLSFYLSQILVACALGWLTLNYLQKERRPKTLVLPLIVGLLLLGIIRSIPIVGAIATIALSCWALGAWLQVWWQTLKQWR